MIPSFLTTSIPNEINPLDAFCCVCRWTLNAKNRGDEKKLWIIPKTSIHCKKLSSPLKSDSHFSKKEVLFV